MIEIKNIEKSFEGRSILSNVSAVMETGKCNLIIGASGSGMGILPLLLLGGVGYFLYKRFANRPPGPSAPAGCGA